MDTSETTCYLPPDFLDRISRQLLNADRDTFNHLRLTGRAGLQAANSAIHHIWATDADQLFSRLRKAFSLPSSSQFPFLKLVTISTFPCLPCKTLWASFNHPRKVLFLVSNPSPDLWKALGEAGALVCISSWRCARQLAAPGVHPLSIKGICYHNLSCVIDPCELPPGSKPEVVLGLILTSKEKALEGAAALKDLRVFTRATPAGLSELPCAKLSMLGVVDSRVPKLFSRVECTLDPLRVATPGLVSLLVRRCLVIDPRGTAQRLFERRPALQVFALELERFQEEDERDLRVRAELRAWIEECGRGMVCIWGGRRVKCFSDPALFVRMGWPRTPPKGNPNPRGGMGRVCCVVEGAGIPCLKTEFIEADSPLLEVPGRG